MRRYIISDPIYFVCFKPYMSELSQENTIFLKLWPLTYSLKFCQKLPTEFTDNSLTSMDYFRFAKFLFVRFLMILKLTVLAFLWYFIWDLEHKNWLAINEWFSAFSFENMIFIERINDNLTAVMLTLRVNTPVLLTTASECMFWYILYTCWGRLKWSKNSWKDKNEK
jgi:hypothetical protein